MVCFDMVYLSKPYHFKFLKGSLPQILLGTFLNTLNHMQIINWTTFLVKKLGMNGPSNQIPTSKILL